MDLSPTPDGTVTKLPPTYTRQPGQCRCVAGFDGSRISEDNPEGVLIVTTGCPQHDPALKE